MDYLIEYFVRIVPGLVLIILSYLILPKKTVFPKIFLLIFSFILIRDALTPMGLWRFGLTDNNLVWFRFIEDKVFLLTFGMICFLITLSIIYFNPELNVYLLWIGENKLYSLIAGLAGAAAVIVPILFIYNSIPINQRGGIVCTSILFPLFVLALLGNFMEEVLFRGYLQGYFEKISSPWRSAILSGFIFAVGHIFLATTVTDLGVMIIAFTLYEGIICGIVRMKHGVIASTLTHALTIFVLASGML